MSDYLLRAAALTGFRAFVCQIVKGLKLSRDVDSEVEFPVPNGLRSIEFTLTAEYAHLLHLLPFARLYATWNVLAV